MKLSMDLSTKVCGYSYTFDNKEYFTNSLDLSKYEELIDKFAILESFVQSLDYITDFGIEKPLLFLGKNSSANTIAKLFAINTFCQYIIKKKYPDVDIHVVASQSARSNIKRLYNLDHTPSKEEVKELLKDKVKYKSKYQSDEADALAVLLYINK